MASWLVDGETEQNRPPVVLEKAVSDFIYMNIYVAVPFLSTIKTSPQYINLHII